MRKNVSDAWEFFNGEWPFEHRFFICADIYDDKMYLPKCVNEIYDSIYIVCSRSEFEFHGMRVDEFWMNGYPPIGAWCQALINDKWVTYFADKNIFKIRPENLRPIPKFRQKAWIYAEKHILNGNKESSVFRYLKSYKVMK